MHEEQQYDMQVALASIVPDREDVSRAKAAKKKAAKQGATLPRGWEMVAAEEDMPDPFPLANDDEKCIGLYFLQVVARVFNIS